MSAAKAARLRRVRREVLDEYLRLFFGPEESAHGLALFVILTRWRCGHSRFVVDWERCRACWICDSEHTIREARELLAEYGITP